MKFTYFNSCYEGTRVQIQRELLDDLTYFNLKYQDSQWSLGNEVMQSDCPPSEARKQLKEKILSKVPEKRVASIDGDDIIITTEGKGTKINIYDLEV